MRITSSIRFWVVVWGYVFLGLVLGDTVPLIWTFQQPTYLIEKDTLGLTEYTCDLTKPECRVNFDFTSSIPTEEPESHYTCVIDFGFGTTSEDAKCNPNTVTFPPGEHAVHVTITHSASAVIAREGTLLIHNTNSDSGGDTGTVPLYSSAITWQNSTQLLRSDDATLSEYICDPDAESCQINLLVAPQKNGQNDSGLTCLVTADFELLSGSDPCNPLQSIVPAGDHTLTIQILSKIDSAVVTTRVITLKNSPIDTSIDPLRVTSTFVWQSPTYLLSKDDTSLIEYVCDPDSTECKINLSVTPLLDGGETSQLTCDITSDFPLDPTSDPCNLSTSIVPTGDHILSIKILQKSDGSVLTSRDILLKNAPIDTSIDPTRVNSSLTWQSPTYLLLKEDTSLLEYTCDSSQLECKINPIFIPLLDGAESSQLTCEVTSDFTFVSTSDPCNPNTSLVPPGDHTVVLKILQKSSNLTLITREILLKNPVRVTGGGGSGGSVGGGSGSVSLMDLNGVQMTVQSGLDGNGTCRSDICQVNFLAEVPTGAVCRWNFGTGVFETDGTDTKCNPGYVKFAFNTRVTFTVSDAMYPTNTYTKTLDIFRAETSIPHLSPQARIDVQGILGKNKRLTEEGIMCAIGNDETCSLNFTGQKSLNAKTYSWNLGNGRISDKENPGAERYPLGKHRIILFVVSETGISSQMYYDIEVVKKFDTLLKEECIDCEKMKGKIQISAVLPNPPHADTVEWIELKNISSETQSLNDCTLSDDTKKYRVSGSLSAGKILRLRQSQTDITLGNSREVLQLHCGEFLVDSFSWNFDIPSGYILRREMLDHPPVEVQVLSSVDGDTIDVMLSGKKTRIRLLGVDTPETVHPRKEVEKFGKEASDFTKKSLVGKTVWMTFDHDPIDHYGRTLGYIWECDDKFDTEKCQLFNARLLSEGYARMERRFEFMYYESFDSLEKEAKKKKIGIWGDPVVANMLNDMSLEEKSLLTKEQEEEYLRLQRELLELEKKKCEEEGICEDVLSWRDITKNITTLSARSLVSGLLKISGRTWGDFPVKIKIFVGNLEVHSIDIRTNTLGEYEFQWYPKIVGEYRVEAFFEEPNVGEVSEENILKLEKTLPIEYISDHFLVPMVGEILVQGRMSKNRWIANDGIFYCQSRGSCSVNLQAEYNRKKDLLYRWILPSGEIFIGKNPPGFKVGYGDFVVTLQVRDAITGESSETLLRIHHGAIPKAPKKISTSASKYTLDLKDATMDMGGGGLPDTSSVSLGGILTVLLCLSGISFLAFGKQKV